MARWSPCLRFADQRTGTVIAISSWSASSAPLSRLPLSLRSARWRVRSEPFVSQRRKKGRDGRREIFGRDHQPADAVAVRRRTCPGSAVFRRRAYTDAGPAKLSDSRRARRGLLCDRLRRWRPLALDMAVPRAARALAANSIHHQRIGRGRLSRGRHYVSVAGSEMAEFDPRRYEDGAGRNGSSSQDLRDRLDHVLRAPGAGAAVRARGPFPVRPHPALHSSKGRESRRPAPGSPAVLVDRQQLPDPHGLSYGRLLLPRT